MSITTTLIRLKLRLLRNGMRKSIWKIVGLAFGILYGVGIVALLVAGLIGLRWQSVELAAAVTTVGFSLVTLGWILFPLLSFGQDDTVDPARFALLPVPARRLLPGLTLAALIGIPGIATTLVSLGLLGTWSRSIPAVLATVITIPIGVVLCVLWSRTLLTWLAALLSGRRTRDLLVVVMMVAVLGFALGVQAIPRLTGDPDQLVGMLMSAADILGFTPFGWIWAVPGAVSQGHFLSAGVRVLLALALVGILAWLWRVRLDVALTSPLETAQENAVRDSAGLAKLLPDGPAGAIALRCLLYWRRDPRYQVALLSLLIAPLALGVVSFTGGGGVLTPWVGLLVAWLVGNSAVSELAYDSSAMSLHALTGVRGAADRAGRAISYLIIGVPIALLVTIGGCALTGQWETLVPVLAIGSVIMLGGLGIGLWLGTFMPGQAPKPGQNPMGAGDGSGFKALLVFGISSLASTIVALPAAALVIGSFIGPSWLAWIGLAVGLATGISCLRVGIAKGGRVLDRRWPELLAEVS